MKVETIYEKGSGRVNEDNLVMKDNIFGVVDGATSFDGFMDEGGRTGGLIVSSIAKEVFENGNGSLVSLMEEANRIVREEMLKRNIDISNKENLWSASAAVVRVDKDHFEWVQLGDSLILVVLNDGTYKLLITDYDHDQETLSKWKELADKKVENIWGKLIEQFLKVRRIMNVAYGVLNGEDEMINFLNKGRESLENVRHIIIFTDGLIIPKKEPREKDDFDKFVRLFNDGGLSKIKNYVRGLEDNDPKCWDYVRFKQHDDIGAISITF